MISLALAAIGFFILSFWANQLMVKILPRPVYLAVLFPGIVLHELSHFFAAILTGTPVTEVNFFSSAGGHVIHQQPRIPVLGQLVISFAPLAAGAGVIYFLSTLIPIKVATQWAVPFSSFSLPVPALATSWHWIFILWIYIILSTTLTLLPSRQDVVASVAGIIVAIFILVLLYMNHWLTIPWAISSMIWYIDISLLILIAILLPAKAILKRR